MITDQEYRDLYKVPKPLKCQRCWLWEPGIRIVDKEKKTVEFICELCKDDDNNLRYKYVKKKER